MCKSVEYREMTGEAESTGLEGGLREPNGDCREPLLLNAVNWSSGTRTSACPGQVVVTPPGLCVTTKTVVGRAPQTKAQPTRI